MLHFWILITSDCADPVPLSKETLSHILSYISSSLQSETCCYLSKSCGISTAVTSVAVTSAHYFPAHPISTSYV